jgi:hypothetical protein
MSVSEEEEEEEEESSANKIERLSKNDYYILKKLTENSISL